MEIPTADDKLVMEISRGNLALFEEATRDFLELVTPPPREISIAQPAELAPERGSEQVEQPRPEAVAHEISR